MSRFITVRDDQGNQLKVDPAKIVMVFRREESDRIYIRGDESGLQPDDPYRGQTGLHMSTADFISQLGGPAFVSCGACRQDSTTLIDTYICPAAVRYVSVIGSRGDWSAAIDLGSGDPIAIDTDKEDMDALWNALRAANAPLQELSSPTIRVSHDDVFLEKLFISPKYVTSIYGRGYNINAHSVEGDSDFRIILGNKEEIVLKERASTATFGPASHFQQQAFTHATAISRIRKLIANNPALVSVPVDNNTLYILPDDILGFSAFHDQYVENGLQIFLKGSNPDPDDSNSLILSYETSEALQQAVNTLDALTSAPSQPAAASVFSPVAPAAPAASATPGAASEPPDSAPHYTHGTWGQYRKDHPKS